MPSENARVLAFRSIRSVIVGAVGVAAAIGLLRYFDGFYPVATWLARTMFTIWGWQLLLAGAVAIGGRFLLVDVLRIRGVSALETLVLAVPVGTVAFVMGMYVAGFLALYGPIFAVVWPTGLLAMGLPSAVLAWRAWRAAGGGPPADARSVAGGAIVAGVLALALGIVYLGALSPEAINYDAGWTHLVIAQDYAREGRIVPFLANWSNNVPHLGSVINTWAFLVPGLSEPATRWMMALHTEFVFFVWTVLGVAAAAGSMLGRMRPPGLAWLVIFLFPSIFVYDSNIGASADHYLAFFSAPLFLAAVGTARTLVPRWWILLAVIASGATLTKVQGAYIVVPAVGLVLAAFVRRLVARSGDVRVPGRIQRLLVGPLVALGCALLLTAPHFLKNIVYHRNPLYPFAQGLFTGSTPSFRGAGVMFDNLFAIWHSRPPSAPLARLKFGLEGMVAFSFAGNGYFRNVPYIGSLFTLSLPMFPFVGGVRRLWPGVAMAVGSLTMWAFMYRVDRNVQIFLPLMAAATAALLVRGWELGKVARVGIVALVAVQATWGADLAFSGQERIDVVPALIRSGINGQAKERFANYRRPYVELGRALPKNAVVLLHNTHQHLGIDRRLLLDWLGFQGLIDHRTFRSSLDIYRRFRELGVTHVVDVHNQHRAATMQEELLFGIFFSEYPPQRTFGSLRLLTLPSTPPPVEPPLQVMLIGIPTQRDGLYDITDLSNLHDLPPDLQFFPPPRAAIAPGGAARLLGGARAALIAPGAPLDAETTTALAAFNAYARFPEYTVYVRRR